MKNGSDKFTTSHLGRGDGPTDEIHQTVCCVVGAGPAGVMLSLLLARAGVPVTLLEAHRDLDRDFRGDTIHPSTLEVLDQIGLADRLHQLPHVKAPSFPVVTPTGVQTALVFDRLPTPFPYMMIMPQSRFLEFLTEEATRYSHFKMVMGANVQRLLEENGTIRGVSYPNEGSQCDVRALLTVAADGRSSRLRKLARLEPISQSAPMEVIWFRLPRRPDDRPVEATLNFGSHQAFVVLGRTHEWQVGAVLPKGGYQRLKTEGLNAFQQLIGSVLPWLGDRVGLLNDWGDVKVLSVEASRLPRWYCPGLLLIGDAAHVMLPVGGVGINCAIADAVEAANVLVEPLREGHLEVGHLSEVQSRRERVTRIVQRAQAAQQKRVLNALQSGQPFRFPPLIRLILRLPGLRNLPARVTAFGVRRVRLEHPEERPVV
jgi:2-polyprenyl-6-methoxyphenol hydroxylase-like FAD-dependent oxidoreductase